MQFAVLQTSLIGLGGGFNSSRWSSTLCLMRKWLLQVFVLHVEGAGSCLESNAAFGAGRVSRKREHNSSSDESDDSVPHPASRPLLIVKHVSTADDAADDAPTDIQVAIDVSDCPEGEGGQSPGEASRLGAECANVSA